VFATAGGMVDPDAYAPLAPASAAACAALRATGGATAWHRHHAAIAAGCGGGSAGVFPYYTPSPFVWLLYHATQATHAGAAHEWPSVFTGVLRARMRREGFAGLATPRGDPTGYGMGAFATVPLSLPDPAAGACNNTASQLWLLLNAETSVAGNITVAVLDAGTLQPLPGYSHDDSVPVWGTSVRSPVGWLRPTASQPSQPLRSTPIPPSATYDLTPLARSPPAGGVMLHVAMVHATLYAWELQCVVAV